MTGYLDEMNPEASFAFRGSVAKMRDTGRVDVKVLEVWRRDLEN